MDDHEQLAEQAEVEALDLERRSERVEQSIGEARETVERAASDAFVATPEPADEPDEGGAESDYPAKD
jgi:hypothetical protein